MFNKFVSLFLSLFVLAGSVACDGRGESALERRVAALERENRQLREGSAPASAAQSAAPTATPAVRPTTEAECTLEALLSTITPVQRAELEKYAAARAEDLRKVEEEKRLTLVFDQVKGQLPSVPGALGKAPEVMLMASRWVTNEPRAEWRGGSQQCQLVYPLLGRLNTSLLPAPVSDWRHIVRHAAVVLSEVVAQWWEFEGKNDRGPERDDYYAGVLFTHGNALFGELEERKVFADRLVAVLARNPAALQWAVGLAKRFLPEDTEKGGGYVARRLQRLHAATVADFRVLDKQVREAETNAALRGGEVPAEFDFACYGDWFKGLVLRRWREHDAKGRGQGDAFVRDLRKVLEGVANEMGVALK